MAEKTMDKIVSLAKARGFVYPGSEIYGGLANTWDYGNLGVELKNNVKKAWWKKFIQESPFNVGVDCAILMNPQTWIASGHLGGFSDPLMDCKQCHERFRADKVIEDYCAENNIELDGAVDAWTQEQMKNFIDENQIPCPTCGKHDFTDIRQFNLMFKTFQGVTEDAKNTVYLRPETAQGIFVNFKNVQRTSRKKLPFGIGQIGKSFRNEITPGNFTFRTREFEQMELEFFCKPGTDLEWFQYWRGFCRDWLLTLGIKEDEPIMMVRKACQRAIDENVVDLQRSYEEFRTKTPLLTAEPLTAYIGKKEGVTAKSRYEVLEVVLLENGSHKYKKVGEIQPIEGQIWDNRFMATEEGAVGSNLNYTTFRAISGKNFAKGMLIREITNK